MGTDFTLNKDAIFQDDSNCIIINPRLAYQVCDHTPRSCQKSEFDVHLAEKKYSQIILAMYFFASFKA